MVEWASEVMVLRVAVVACGVAFRVRVGDSREQVAYWAELMGLQVRATMPVKLLVGVRFRL